MSFLSLTPFTVLLVAGCVSLPSFGSGVVIETFEPDFTSVFNGEPVTFRIQIRNSGSLPSEGGEVRILGLNEWGSPQGTCPFGRLLPPTSTVPGASHTCSLTFIAPDVPPTIPVSYQASARLSYSYASQALTTVTIGTQQELKRLESIGRALTTGQSFQSTSPITVSARVQGPIRVFEESVTFPVDITLTNSGGGTVCHGDHTSCSNNNNWNIIFITTTLGDSVVDNCSKQVTLFGGQSLSFTCQASTGLTQALTEKTLQVEATYGYFVDVDTPITVNWRDTGPGF